MIRIRRMLAPSAAALVMAAQPFELHAAPSVYWFRIQP